MPVIDGAKTIGLQERPHPEISDLSMADRKPVIETKTAGSTQALDRAIDILEVVARGPILLADLATELSLPMTTTYRLAQTLARRGLLDVSRRAGYRIGQRLYELGSTYAEEPAPR